MKSYAGIALSLFVIFTVSFLVAESMGFMEERYVLGQLKALKNQDGGIILLSVAIAGILTLDLFFPVPSSILMFTSGVFTGFLWGTVINLIGALGSAVIGFAICRKFGRDAFERVTGKQDVERVEHIFETYGVWAILLSRSVPMITEVVSCMAGLTTMSFKRFLFFTIAGTFPVCLVYAYIGSLGFADVTQLGWSALIALILPAVGYGIIRLTMLRR